MPGWRVHTDHTRAVHAWPEDDLVDHDTDDDDGGCICGPLVVPIPRVDDSYGWVIAHHPLDRRP